MPLSRVLAAWFLALLLPVQGLAAETKLLCGSMLGHEQRAGSVRLAGQEHGSHGGMQAAAVGGSGGAAQASTHETGSCAACMTLCQAANLTAEAVVQPSTDLAQSVPAAQTLGVLMRPLDVADKPPRS